MRLSLLLLIGSISFLTVNAQMSKKEYGSLINDIFHGGCCRDYVVDPYPEVLPDSLEKIKQMPAKEQIVLLLDLIKQKKISYNGFKYLQEDSLTFNLRLLGKQNCISIAYFIYTCEYYQTAYSYYGNYYDSKVNSYLAFDEKWPLSNLFSLYSLKKYYDRTENNNFRFKVLENEIEITTTPSELRASEMYEKQATLKDSILSSFYDLGHSKTNYYKILYQLLTRPTNNNKEWKQFQKLGEIIFNPPINYSKGINLETYYFKRGIPFQEDYKKAYTMRFVKSPFFTKEQIPFLEKLYGEDKSFYNIIYEFRPEIFRSYWKDLNKDECYKNYINHFSVYIHFIRGLKYCKEIGNPLMPLSEKVDFLIYK